MNGLGAPPVAPSARYPLLARLARTASEVTATRRSNATANSPMMMYVFRVRPLRSTWSEPESPATASSATAPLSAFGEAVMRADVDATDADDAEGWGANVCLSSAEVSKRAEEGPVYASCVVVGVTPYVEVK